MSATLRLLAAALILGVAVVSVEAALVIAVILATGSGALAALHAVAADRALRKLAELPDLPVPGRGEGSPTTRALLPEAAGDILFVRLDRPHGGTPVAILSWHPPLRSYRVEERWTLAELETCRGALRARGESCLAVDAAIEALSPGSAGGAASRSALNPDDPPEPPTGLVSLRSARDVVHPGTGPRLRASFGARGPIKELSFTYYGRPVTLEVSEAGGYWSYRDEVGGGGAATFHEALAFALGRARSQEVAVVERRFDLMREERLTEHLSVDAGGRRERGARRRPPARAGTNAGNGEED